MYFVMYCQSWAPTLKINDDYNQNSHRQPTPLLNNRCSTTDTPQPTTANDNNDRQSTKKHPTSDTQKKQPTEKKYQQE
jgi:hypothetical protein